MMSEDMQENNLGCTMIIGQNLRELRLKSQLTQKKIAHELNVSFQQIQKYETGKNRLPIEHLLKLKHLYDVPFDVFFQGLDIQQNRSRPSTF